MHYILNINIYIVFFFFGNNIFTLPTIPQISWRRLTAQPDNEDRNSTWGSQDIGKSTTLRVSLEEQY
jgi:hypothetical protein